MKREWVDQQRTLTVAVAGIVAGGHDISHVLDGDPVVLVAEPANPFDAHAIRVDSVNGETLGHLPAKWAAALDAGDWTARVDFVALHPETGAPAGLRLELKRRSLAA